MVTKNASKQGDPVYSIHINFLEVLYMDIENNIENHSIVEIDDASDRFDDVKIELSDNADMCLNYLVIAC